MSQVVIENPIINSPFDEPTRHFRYSDQGITYETVDARRASSYFVPIARPKKTGSKQLQFDTEWTQDRIEENKLVNDIRRRVALWRKGGYVCSTATRLGGSRCRSHARRAYMSSNPCGTVGFGRRVYKSGFLVALARAVGVVIIGRAVQV